MCGHQTNLEKKVVNYENKKRNKKLEDIFLNFDTILRELVNKLEEKDKVCHLLLTLNEDYNVNNVIETVNQNVRME